MILRGCLGKVETGKGIREVYNWVILEVISFWVFCCNIRMYMKKYLFKENLSFKVKNFLESFVKRVICERSRLVYILVIFKIVES